MLPRRHIVAGVTLLLALAGCGSPAPTATDADAPDAGSADAPMSETSAPGPSAGGLTPAPQAPTDPSSVDWATVDLTTVDWATLDLRRVDWQAIEDNPSAANLGDDVGALIQSRLDPGSATLTIGEVVYEFDRFDCASGHENTESDTFSFTTNSFGDFEGVRTQMQFTVEDPTSTGQLDGEGVQHRIDFDDIDDFENPSISWSMRQVDSVRIEGYLLSVSGTFDDGLTEGAVEEIAGSLEAECSDMSRFG